MQGVQRVSANMTLEDVAKELFDTNFRTTCLKSTDPNIRLRYLETVISYNTAISQPYLTDTFVKDLTTAIRSIGLR